MVPIKCSECGELFDRARAACPNCGCPTEPALPMAQQVAPAKPASKIPSTKIAPMPSSLAPAYSAGRRPWLLYGGLLWSLALLMIGAFELLATWRVVTGQSRPSTEVIEPIGAGLFVLGFPLLLYGLLTKYVLHRGQPVRAAPLLRSAVSILFLMAIICSLGLLLISELVGARPRGQGDAARQHNPERPVVFGPASQFELTLPAGWEEIPKPAVPGIQLAASHVLEDLHLFVFCEDRRDLANMTLENYAQLLTKKLLKSVGQARKARSQYLQVGKVPAIQSEVHGTVDMVNLGLLQTYLVTTNHYVQIRIWTTESKFAIHQHDFETIAGSFKTITKDVP